MPYVSARYSVAEHLAQAILFSRWKEALMAVFTSYTAYFDASGHPAQHEALTVSGYVSTVKKWTRFEREWKAILDSESVSEFHTTEFVSSQGEFANGWKGNVERRRSFIERLTDCVKRNTNKSFRATVVLSDYRRTNQMFCLEEECRPYAVCGMQCLYMVKEWAERKGAGKKTLVFFEDGDKDKGNFELRAERVYGERPLFLPKAKAVPFQAADFAGWKVRTLIEESLRDKTLPDQTKGRRRLDSLSKLPRVPLDGGVINELALVEFCKAQGVPLRNYAKLSPDANEKGQTAQ